MIIGSLHGIVRPPREPGLCSKISDPDTFFSTNIADVKEAKLMCAACPIRQRCLDKALEKSRLAGTWGGLTETERRSVREGRRTLTSAFDCAFCSRPFMPRREDAKFCTRACQRDSKKVRRIPQSSPVSAQSNVRLDLLAKTG